MYYNASVTVRDLNQQWSCECVIWNNINTSTVQFRGHNGLCFHHRQMLLRGWGGRAYRVYGSKMVMNEEHGWENQKEKVHMKDLGIDEVILKWL